MARAKKIPMVHYRVMHRKRVTSELHDSYFRLMTIKYSISKIEWASNDYISQLSSTSQLNWVSGSWVPAREFEFQWRRDVVGKATPGRRGLGPWWAEVRIRCNKESHHTEEWGPRPPVEQHWRTRKTQRDGRNSGVKMLQFMFGLQLPLTVKPHTSLSNPYK